MEQRGSGPLAAPQRGEAELFGASDGGDQGQGGGIGDRPAISTNACRGGAGRAVGKGNRGRGQS